MSAVENDRATSAVRSVEASSTTIISKSIPVWVTTDSRQDARQASSFLAGTMTETTRFCLSIFMPLRYLSAYIPNSVCETMGSDGADGSPRTR